MLATLRRHLKWGQLTKSAEEKSKPSSLLLTALIGRLEDVLFWRKLWLSLGFILTLNIFFLICLHFNTNLVEILFYFFIAIVTLDAFEAWLKYKHRTTYLKKIARKNGANLSSAAAHLKDWMKIRWNDYIYLRETNHTKAFLLVNVILGIIFLIGKCLSGNKLIYIVLMTACFFYKIAPPIIRFTKKIHQNAESDVELEGLIPDASDVDIKVLSIEPEHDQVIDEKQSLDYWKPEDIPIDDGSDSSDHSTSLITNISKEKMQAFVKEVETSDSSEDEYIPLVEPREKLQSTLEEVQPASTWGGTAYNAFFTIAGAVSNMVYAAPEDKTRKRVSSIDSSDGFEMIDKNELN